MMETDNSIVSPDVYLKNINLYWKKYTRQIPEWDHDQCEFCGKTFAEDSCVPEALHEGYATDNNYYWVCNNCYENFKNDFHWKIGKPEPSK